MYPNDLNPAAYVQKLNKILSKLQPEVDLSEMSTDPDRMLNNKRSKHGDKRKDPKYWRTQYNKLGLIAHRSKNI